MRPHKVNYPTHDLELCRKMPEGYGIWSRENRKLKNLKRRYMGPYFITYRIGVVAYFMALPQELSSFHYVFPHVQSAESCHRTRIDFTKTASRFMPKFNCIK